MNKYFVILFEILEILSHYFMRSRVTFDWVPRFDEKSKDFGVREILPKESIISSSSWSYGPQLDQGREGACVGFAFTHGLLAKPLPIDPEPEIMPATKLAQSIYRNAQKIDEWPGHDYDGTSILAGAKIARRRGYIAEYRWCFTIEDIRDTILNVGPVVAGVLWNRHLSFPMHSGLVHLGSDLGNGHAILIDGYFPNMKFGNVEHEVFRFKNSWGSSYGIGGSAFIKAADLKKLLDAGGEFCVLISKQNNFISKDLSFVVE